MAAAADRNLLFGILALQNNFITREQLLAAFNAWVVAKDKALGDILFEQKALDADIRALLDALAAKHVAMHGDDPEKSLAAVPVSPWLHQQIKSLCHPDLEASLAHLGAASADSSPLSPLGRGARGEGHDPHATISHIPADTGLRYRILRPHAKGGLGEVFVAEDTELHREVALKEIQPQHAGHDSSRGRFVLEAEITGGLEHPGIRPRLRLGNLRRRPPVLRDAFHPRR